MMSGFTNIAASATRFFCPARKLIRRGIDQIGNLNSAFHSIADAALSRLPAVPLSRAKRDFLADRVSTKSCASRLEHKAHTLINRNGREL